MYDNMRAMLVGVRPLVVAACSLIGGTAAADPAFDPLTSGGNLRVDVRCADFWATPDHGLRVSVDGVAQPARMNGVDTVGYGAHSVWEPTDVGFVVAPGHHRLAIAAPGCASSARDVDISAEFATHVTGRLEVTDPALAAPITAPDGTGLALGYFHIPHPAHPDYDDSYQTSYAYDRSTYQGLLLSVLYEHRNLAAIGDLGFGTASMSGIATYVGAELPDGATRLPQPFAGTTHVVRLDVRVGARIPARWFGLSGGAGLGVNAYLPVTNFSEEGVITLAHAPNDPQGDVFVPAWAAFTVKPMCSWGAQLVATYDIHPTSTGESAAMISAGVIWQPSSACSEPPHLEVK